MRRENRYYRTMQLNTKIPIVPSPTGRECFAHVTMRRRGKYYDVTWSPGDIDLMYPAHHVFEDRLEAAGVPAALERWLNQHSDLPRRPEIASNGGRGWCYRLPESAARELAALVVELFTPHLSELPKPRPF